MDQIPHSEKVADQIHVTKVTLHMKPILRITEQEEELSHTEGTHRAVHIKIGRNNIANHITDQIITVRILQHAHLDHESRH